MRYWGQAALSGVPLIGSVCESDACYGQQAAYRISGAMFAFFFILALITATCKVAHLGAWLAKVIAFIAVLAITLAIPNSALFMSDNHCPCFFHANSACRFLGRILTFC